MSNNKKPILHLPSIFFGNIDKIWPNAKDYSTLMRSYKALSSRSLLMAGINDKVIVDQIPDPEYLSLLHACGAGGEPYISSSSNEVCLCDDVANSPELVELFKEWDGDYEVYMPSDAEERLGGIIGKGIIKTPAKVVELLNDKLFFTKLAEDLGFPVIDTFIGDSNSVAARIKKDPDKNVVVKGRASIGGSQVFSGRTPKERSALIKFLDKVGQGELLLLQPYIPHTLSPNLQFYISDEKIDLFGRTIQALDKELGHFGNYFDTLEDESISDRLLEIGAAFASEAGAMGYRGVIGVDFIVTETEGVYPVEINTRHNTSTHALFFVNRFFGGDPFGMIEPERAAFLRFSTKKRVTAIEWIDLLGADTFDPDKGRGIMPYNIADGFSFLAVGDDREDRELLIKTATKICNN